MGYNVPEFRERMMSFSLRILKVCAALPDTPEGRIVRGQLLRAGTSPGAQHREACRARSAAEFISKMESEQQELDETGYWLELVERGGFLPATQLKYVREEVNELLAIFAASAKTAKANR